MIYRGSKWAAIAGGSIGTPDCGDIDVQFARSPEAAFFSLSGSRFLQTQSLNLTDALYVSSRVSVYYSSMILDALGRSVVFQIKIGGDGGCEPADSGDDVVLEYKNSNSLDFTTLQLMAHDRM